VAHEQQPGNPDRISQSCSGPAFLYGRRSDNRLVAMPEALPQGRRGKGVMSQSLGKVYIRGLEARTLQVQTQRR
jgi:hypothetical protein